MNAHLLDTDMLSLFRQAGEIFEPVVLERLVSALKQSKETRR